MAALQGVDLDAETTKEDAETRFKNAEREGLAQLAGMSAEKYELEMENGFFGFEEEE